MCAIVKNGRIISLGGGFGLVQGRYPNKVDDVDIGPNNSNGLSVNHGEIIQNRGTDIRVFSAEPMFNGVSPASLLYGGANPNKVFAMQELWKRTHRVRDDGTRYQGGGAKRVNFSTLNTTRKRPFNEEFISYINDKFIENNIPADERAIYLAHIIEESGGNPFADSGTGFNGLFQWSDARHQKVLKGDPFEEIDNQLKYFLSTVNNTTDKMSWSYGGDESGYDSFKDARADFLSNDFDRKAKGFSFGYVRPAGKEDSHQNRLKLAKQIYGLEGFQYGGNKRVKARDGKTLFNKEKILNRVYGDDMTLLSKGNSGIIDSIWQYLFNNDSAVDARIADAEKAYEKYKDIIELDNGNKKWNAIEKLSDEEKREYDLGEVVNEIKQHEDAKRIYLGYESKYDTMQKSKYLPTIGIANNPHEIKYLLTKKAFDKVIYPIYSSWKNKDGKYKVNTFSGKINGIDDLGKTALVKNIPFLNNATISEGFDEKGQYISLYDTWDYNTRYMNKSGDNIGKFVGGKPFDIYQRYYLDDYLDIPEEHRGNPYIAPAEITENKNENKQFGGTMSKRKKAKLGAQSPDDILDTYAFVNALREEAGGNRMYGHTEPFIGRDGQIHTGGVVTFSDDANPSLMGSLPKVGFKPSIVLGSNSTNIITPSVDVPDKSNSTNIITPSVDVPDKSSLTKRFAIDPSFRAKTTGYTPSVKPTTVGSENTSSTASTPSSSGLSKMDLIGLGVGAANNVIGLASNLITSKYQKPIIKQAPVLHSTRLVDRVRPYVDSIREQAAKMAYLNDRTAASSRTRFARAQDINANKNLQETAEVNRADQASIALQNNSLYNQQNIRNQNAINATNVANENAAARTLLHNQKVQDINDSIAQFVNNGNDLINGERGILARKDAKELDRRTLAAMLAANPYAAEAYKKGLFKKMYDILGV